MRSLETDLGTTQQRFVKVSKLGDNFTIQPFVKLFLLTISYIVITDF